MLAKHWENFGGNILDKYTVKMFPQAYRDIDKIYEQALLVSNYPDDAIELADKIEKAIFSLEEQPYREQNGNMDSMRLKDIASYW